MFNLSACFGIHLAKEPATPIRCLKGRFAAFVLVWMACLASCELSAHVPTGLMSSPGASNPGQGSARCVLLTNEGLLPLKDLPDGGLQWWVPSGELVALPAQLRLFGPLRVLPSLETATQGGALLVGLELDHLTPSAWARLQPQLAKFPRRIVAAFGTEAQLATFAGMEQQPALLLTTTSGASSQRHVAQVVYGALGTDDRLQGTGNPHFPKGSGRTLKGGHRLAYTTPEAVQWDGQRLKRRIDSLIHYALDQKAFPGCQVLVAKDGQVVFHQNYGHHTYQRQRLVQLDDLYDFASLTKITGPLPPLMKLVDEGAFQLDVPLATYWPDFQRRKDKRELRVRDILAHQARLKPYLVYWQNTLNNNGGFKWRTFRKQGGDPYTVPVDSSLYLHKKYRKKIYKAIRKSELNETPGYVYSGLSFLLYPQIITNLTGRPYNDYLQEEFFQPLGATTLGYNPWKRFPLERIVPTEVDTAFRKRLVHGYVHDEAAAMFGGVSGNAGLFGSANDLAKLMQMYLNMGTYGGQRYIDSITLSVFTRYQFPEQGNRRGLGFDKPLIERKGQGYIAPDASVHSFGHSGFTGTFTWADPEHNLLLVFMSNRVHPTRENTLLYRLNIRPSLHQVLYDEIRWSREAGSTDN